MELNKPWEIDIALRYYPIVQHLKTNYTGDMKILEIGSGGEGIFAFFQAPITVLDTYFDESFRDHNGMITKVTSSSETMPFQDHSFDVIISVDMFEHLSPEGRERTTKELFRVLKPGGTIIVTFPSGRISAFLEKVLNAVYRVFKGRENPWLHEHILNGLPDSDDFIQHLKHADGSARIKTVANANVFMWFGLYIFNLLLPDPVRVPVMKLGFPIFRNINFLPYRRIFVVSSK